MQATSRGPSKRQSGSTGAAALAKASSYDSQGAETAFRRAIELADRVDRDAVKRNLAELRSADQNDKLSPQAKREMSHLAEDWLNLSDAPYLARINFANFLIQQRRYQEAFDLLIWILKHEGQKSLSGIHQNFGDFATAYAQGVGIDTITGAFMAPIGRFAGERLATGSIGRSTGLEPLVRQFPNLSPFAETTWTLGLPIWMERERLNRFNTYELEPILNSLQTPATRDELRAQYRHLRQMFESAGVEFHGFPKDSGSAAKTSTTPH